MKKVMVRAWEIARQGVKKFGGKAIEYLAEALRMAWAEFKMAVANERGNIQLKGTEKQIAWAKAIRKQYMKAFDEFFQMFAETKGGKKVENFNEAKKEIMEALFNKTDAKYYIETIRGIETANTFKETYIAELLNELLKDMMEERHVGALRFRNFFGGRRITGPQIDEIIKKHKVRY